MNSMRNYYISRTVVAILFGMLFMLLGAEWWMGLLAGLLALAGFAWAPRSGRYVKETGQDGQVRLAHDENTRAIADKAARNGFVVSMILLAVLTLYFWQVGQEMIPIQYLQAVLVSGLLTYAISDTVIRRAGPGRPGRGG